MEMRREPTAAGRRTRPDQVAWSPAVDPRTGSAQRTRWPVQRGAKLEARRRPPPVRPWARSVKYSLVFLILVMVGRVHEAIPGMAGLPLASIAMALAGLAMLSRGGTASFLATLRMRSTHLAAAFLIWAVVTVPFALWPGGALSELASLSKTWVLFILLVSAIRTPAQFRTIGVTFAVAGAVLVTGQVLEAVFGVSALSDRQALAFDRNDIALIAVMSIPFALAWSATSRRGGWRGYVLAGYLAVGVVASGSRGGFLAMSAVAIAFFLRGKLSTGRKVIILACAAIAVSVVGSGEYWNKIGSVFTNPTEDYNFQVREGRIEIWKRGLGYTLEHPITGVGVGNFPVAEGLALDDEGYGVKWSTAHSAYVLVLAELGLPGFALFLLMLLSPFFSSRRLARALKSIPARDRDRLNALGQATQQSFIGFAIGAAFLSAAYSVAFVFLFSTGACLEVMMRKGQGSRVQTRPSR